MYEQNLFLTKNFTKLSNSTKTHITFKEQQKKLNGIHKKYS